MTRVNLRLTIERQVIGILRDQHVRQQDWSPRASLRVLPAATPVVRSAAAASLTYARTACAAAWRSAASDVRSHSRGRVVADVASGSALAMHLQEERSDREALPLTCAEYRMNSRCHDLLRAKKLCKRTSRVTPITAGPRCAPAAANQCPPAASITALPSA